MKLLILLLIVPFLGTISLQLRNEDHRALKKTLNCCKLQAVAFNSQKTLSNVFKFKHLMSHNLLSGVVY